MRTVQWLAFDDRDMPSLHISELKKKKRFRTAYFLLIFEKVILHWLSIKECVEFLLYHYGARITTPVGPVITGSLPADE